MPILKNQCALQFEFQYQKLLSLHYNSYILFSCIDLATKQYRGLWFNRTHLLLFQNMSVRIYTNFPLSSGGYNFKIIYLKDKMRYGMLVRILLNNLASSALQHGYCFLHRRSKRYEKVVKFYPEIFEFKVFLRWSN